MVLTTPNNGQLSGPNLLAKAIQVVQQPNVTLKLYDFGAILETPTSRYPISPDALVKALIKNLPEEEFSTGLLSDDILYVWQKGSKRVVVSYRKPQLTGIWLDGSEDALRVPMPGLVMARSWRDDTKHPNYYTCAVLRKPQMGSKVFNTPLPNAGNGTSVCWGTVEAPPPNILKSCDMQHDWTLFLGSLFGSHHVSHKSKTHTDDIRKLLIELDKDKKRTFPKDELVHEKHTFRDWINSICR